VIKKALAILGSTGSIGQSTLDVVRINSGVFRVVTLAAGTNIALLKKQIREFKPRFVSVKNEAACRRLEKEFAKEFVNDKIEFGNGPDGAVRAAAFRGVDIVVSAIVGAAGFLPTLAAIKAGRNIALANKESLVIGGGLVMAAARKKGVSILPVDSEHSAIFQAMKGHRKNELKRVILTASGGPFVNTPIEELASVTPERALKHPTWTMGRRITIDSATLMNKGFEVIEACALFNLPPSKVSVCIHPQSIVHSIVEFKDGSMISQMGPSDMKGPISYALAYPGRINSGIEPFELAGKTLEFIEPDLRKFPCLTLAFKVAALGGTYPAALNAADEVAVDFFLKGMIKYTDIYEVIDTVLDGHSSVAADSVEAILEADRWARVQARRIAKKKN